jgi:beta-1,4-mannosyltransferase
VTTHVARSRRDEPGDRTQIIPTQRLGETQVMPAVRIPITKRGATMAQRHAGWLPRLWPLALWFVIVLVVTLWLSEKSTGPLGPVVTVLWTYPVIGTAVGLLGALITRRRLRRDRLTAADDQIIRCKERLVVVVPTIGRHDTYPALDRVVHSYITYLPECFDKLRVDVVIEEGCEAAEEIHRLGKISRYIRVVTVPRSYHTVNGTKFKSRANNYAHELRIAQHEDRDDVWVLHMDDDTGVGLDTAIALARLIEQQRALGDKACHLAQGILTYPREHARNRLIWLADASRPIADVTVYSAFTGGGHPLAGVHGELLLVRASVEAEIGWDFGPEAIVEDAQFALIFSRRFPGRSAWFAGRCYGASPATVRDFFRQRERWAWGLIGLALDDRIPLRDRLYIGYTVPVTLAVLPIWALNMAYAIWLYAEGLRINVSVSRRARYRWWEGIAVILLVPIFSLMEGIGALRGLIRHLRGGQQQFVVIAKPI